MNLFFDLDGTLIDARPRMYGLWQQLVQASPLSFDEYWDLKRDKISHERLLKERFGYSEEAIGTFNKQWLARIEEPEWLSMDKPFEGVADFLAECSKAHHVYIVTARQFEDRAVQQISQYPWAGTIKKILVSNKTNGKFELVRELLGSGDHEAGPGADHPVSQPNGRSQGWFIGDTGKDIETGKALGLKTAAVLSGFLSRKRLLEYHPDQIINNVTELVYV